MSTLSWLICGSTLAYTTHLLFQIIFLRTITSTWTFIVPSNKVQKSTRFTFSSHDIILLLPFGVAVTAVSCFLLTTSTSTFSLSSLYWGGTSIRLLRLDATKSTTVVEEANSKYQVRSLDWHLPGTWYGSFSHLISSLMTTALQEHTQVDSCSQ